jgi:hypothetical protein
MRIPEADRPGTHLASLARWLGIDRNPLRRRTDRIEAAIRIATVLLLLVAMPLAAIAASRLADHHELRQAAEERQVAAVLLQRAAGAGSADPYTSTQTVVSARWQPPGQPPRFGKVLAAVGARAGSTETIWIDASGTATGPPPDGGVIAAAICVAVMNTCLTAGLLLLVSNGLARYVLERRRLSAWGAEWRAISPLWRRYRS